MWVPAPAEKCTKVGAFPAGQFDMSLIIPSPVEKVINIVIDAVMFLVKKWRWFAIFAGIVLFFVLIGFIFRAFHRTPKLNQPEIQRAQKAIAVNDGEEMTKVLVESDVREKHIDENLANGNSVKVDAINESKKIWANTSNEEKAAELERRAKE
jgi:hypothetical protein